MDNDPCNRRLSVSYLFRLFYKMALWEAFDVPRKANHLRHSPFSQPHKSHEALILLEVLVQSLFGNGPFWPLHLAF